MNKPIMAKATAVWLVDNTSLTFEQIAKFCDMHLLEVEGIANDDVAVGILGIDPIAGNQLDKAEIKKGEADPNYAIQLKIPASVKDEKKRIGNRYTPVAKRQDRPRAILWLIKNHPEIPDSHICKLIGTTKTTIDAIRNRTHWNISNIQPVDPVALGLCKQSSLDTALKKAAAKSKSKKDKSEPEEDKFLLPIKESLSDTALK